MLWIFVSALLFGGVLIAIGLLGHDGHESSTLHTGALDGDVGDMGLLALLSLRNLTWASFAFGGVGLLATLTRRSPTTTIASSTLAAVVTLLVVHTLFRALRRSAFESNPSDLQAIGSTAKLVLPFDQSNGMGVITFIANGQVVEMPAKRADGYEHTDSALFATCRIDIIRDGIALVLPAS